MEMMLKHGLLRYGLTLLLVDDAAVKRSGNMLSE